jgi:hypothetical protein
VGPVAHAVRVADGVGSRNSNNATALGRGQVDLRHLQRSESRGRRRNQPTLGGSLCSSSGQRVATTARVSSEIGPVIVSLRTLLWIRCRSAGIITLPRTIRGS